MNLNQVQDGMVQSKYGVYALDVKNIIDFWIPQKFNSCSTHEEEAGILSLGTLYPLTEKMHAL